MTQRRQIIQIDEEKCDGCGLCLTDCPEGALALVNGKARLVRESYCDGLGACLGACPQGALKVVEAPSEGYDEAGVIAHLRQTTPDLLARHMQHLAAHAADPSPSPSRAWPCMSPERTAVPGGFPLPAPGRGAGGLGSHAPDPSPEWTGEPDSLLPRREGGQGVRSAGCPSAQVRAFAPRAMPMESDGPVQRTPSALRQWPVQLRLLTPKAPFFEGAHLALVADCVPFAYPDLHANILAGEGVAVAVGCPKFDDAGAYIEKVAQILQANEIRSLKVYYMEVPCCRGLVWIAEQALQRSGKDIPLVREVIKIRE